MGRGSDASPLELRMPERLATTETETRASAVTAEERRQIRRVGVAMQARIRNADLEDGDFEEIRTTLNASKKAIYFFTPLNGYYKGMKLRVIFPYDAHTSANLEQCGEVVRVHRRGTGFGVAVALKADRDTVKASAYAQGPADPFVVEPKSRKEVRHEERRCAKRASFIAPVELMDMRGGSRIKARVADLSLHGCYVDTLNPLPSGSAVRLQIQRGGEMLDVLATVSSELAGSGMGLQFGDTTPEQRALIKSWLAEAPLAAQGSLGRPQSAAKAKNSADTDQVYAVRLINALVRKGILSKSEATELLSDPEG
jgi:PilZ domain